MAYDEYVVSFSSMALIQIVCLNCPNNVFLFELQNFLPSFSPGCRERKKLVPTIAYIHWLSTVNCFFDKKESYWKLLDLIISLTGKSCLRWFKYLSWPWSQKGQLIIAFILDFCHESVMHWIYSMVLYIRTLMLPNKLLNK